MMVFTVKTTEQIPSLDMAQNKRNVPDFHPKSNITGPNNSNVAAGSVFGNLRR